jgi:cytochrome c-type biogenesis protein CcmE
MKWKYFALRVIVGSAIAICFYVTTGFGSILQTAAIGMTASLGAQAAVFAVRSIGGEDSVSFLAIGGLALAAVAAAVFVVVIAKSPPEPVRFSGVDALMKSPARNVGPFFKVHGFVENGSIQRRTDAGEQETTFVIHENGARVAVELRGPVPDTFRDGAEIVVTGHLRRGRDTSDFVFVAAELMAKCPSTYNTKDGPRPAAKFR